VRDWRLKGYRDILIGLVAGAGVVFFILLSVNFNLSVLLPSIPHAHYLSFRNSPDEYQAYGLFSFIHAVDLFNMAVLMSPWAFVLIGVGFSRNKKVLISSDPARFLLLSVVPVCLFVAFAKFDLGMAKDWDVGAPYFFIIACYSVIVFVGSQESVNIRFLTVILVVTILTSGVWFTLNASRTPAISRATSLLDKRNLPRGGYYQSVFHLSMYYLSERDIGSMADIWENFIVNFPQDPRGYQKKAKALWEMGEPGFDDVSVVFERWLRTGVESSKANKEYAAFCFDAGNVCYNRLELDKARELFGRSIRLDPMMVPAYNNLGIVLARRGDIDAAIGLYHTAIRIDSGYAQAYRNMGRALTQKGDLVGAIDFFRQAIERDPGLFDAYEDLAGVYYSMKEYDACTRILEQAVRAGSTTAWQVLRSQQSAGN
jgi:tetratricopeptide (TPR) repeat protein